MVYRNCGKNYRSLGNRGKVPLRTKKPAQWRASWVAVMLFVPVHASLGVPHN